MKKSGSWTVAGALVTLALLIGMSVHAYRLSQGVAVQEAALERAKEQFDAKLQEASEKLDRARQSAEQAAAERDRLAAQIATITTASNSLGQQLSEKSKQIEQLEASLAETRQTLARAGEDRRQLDEVAESRSGRITELESDRERLQTDLRTVESDLESTAARLEEKAVMLLSLGAAQLQARQALDKAESASEALNRELSASRARGDELEAKNSVLRRQLEQENITNAQMSASARARKHNECTRWALWAGFLVLPSDLDGLRLAFAELEAQLREREAKVTRLTGTRDVAKASVESLASELEVSRGQIQTLEAATAALQTELAEARADARRQVADVENLLSTLEQQRSELAETQSLLAARNASLAEQSRSLEFAEMSMQELETTLGVATARVMELEALNSQLEDWTLLTKVETSCDRILIAGGANVEAAWEQGPAV